MELAAAYAYRSCQSVCWLKAVTAALRMVRMIAVTILLLMLLATWPHMFALERFPIVAQLTALRGLLVLTGVIGILGLGLLAWRSGAWRRWALSLSAGLIIVVAANTWIMSQRGFEVEVATVDAVDLTVFMWNVYRDGAGPELVAEFATFNEVDVIVLLEVGMQSVEYVAEHLQQAGRPVQVFASSFHPPESPRYTALLISESLGDYTQDAEVGSTVRVPSVVARPVQGQGTVFVAGHAAPPFPGMMWAWSQGVRWLADRCNEADVVMLGDFNSTLDHFSGLRSAGAHVGGCRDAARSLGGGALGTWPSQLPMVLGSPIDHVVASESWEFSGYRIVTELDGMGSDHRALLVQLRRVQDVEDLRGQLGIQSLSICFTPGCN